MNVFFLIFSRFFYLGLISFGGPAAHLGYFQRYFVTQHQWLEQKKYSQLVALSQFLPGPSSSQVGFAIGYQRAGLTGAIAAFLGFTLPSFLLMYSLVILGNNFQDSTTFVGLITGLKLFAVVIVADAIFVMAKAFCQKLSAQLIALMTTCCLILFPQLMTQLVVLLCAGVFGYFIHRGNTPENLTTDLHNALANKIKKSWLITFVLLLLILPLMTQYNLIQANEWLQLFSNFYQSGSLVFGGGHVVMPLLQHGISAEISNDSFLLGYSAAQAVPGPMFTMATYLGGIIMSSSPLLGALVATLAIFLPGFLLMLAFYYAWQQLMLKPSVGGIVFGVNAAVVGLLAAALYQPVAISAIHSFIDVIAVLLGFALLRLAKLPIIALIVMYCGIGVLLVQISQ